MNHSLKSRTWQITPYTDKYIRSIPTYDLMYKLLNTDLTVTVDYETFIKDEFATEVAMIDMINPKTDELTRLILCNQALVQKGNDASVVDFMKAIGINVEIEHIPNSYDIIANVDFQDIDVQDIAAFNNLLSKLIYELLFYGNSNIFIVYIKFNFIVNSTEIFKCIVQPINTIVVTELIRE